VKRQTVIFWAGLAVALVVVGFITGGQRTDGPPLDPSSTGPLGTKGLTELMDAFGTDVRRGVPRSTSETALVLVDRLTEAERADLVSWVERGGRLVVADPSSPLSPSLADLQTTDLLLRRSCDVVGIDGSLELAGSSFGRYATSTMEASCFGDGRLAHVVVETMGTGEIISLGGAVTLTNENLDQADNAVLAVELLAGPATELAIVYDAGAVGGERTLADLIPRSVRWFGWQLALAFAIYVLWRGRRFGRVVIEPQAVEIPGSLLVRATGELARRSGGATAAGERMRLDLDRRLRREYRLPTDISTAQMVSIVAARSDADPAALGRALLGPLPTEGRSLVQFLADVDSTRPAAHVPLQETTVTTTTGRRP
jgi:hypothetical protein